jgi:hypothetical protein
MTKKYMFFQQWWVNFGHEYQEEFAGHIKSIYIFYSHVININILS